MRPKIDRMGSTVDWNNPDLEERFLAVRVDELEALDGDLSGEVHDSLEFEINILLIDQLPFVRRS